MRDFFHEVRGRTLAELNGLDPDRLGRIVDIPDTPVRFSLRSWLWFVLEHELLGGF